MESLFEALAFLVQAITIGGITAAILTVIGIVPIEVTRVFEIHVDEAYKATEVLKSLKITLRDPDELEDKEDSEDGF
jgi:type IV secretory pathway component VirB8